MRMNDIQFIYYTFLTAFGRNATQQSWMHNRYFRSMCFVNQWNVSHWWHTRLGYMKFHTKYSFLCCIQTELAKSVVTVSFFLFFDLNSRWMISKWFWWVCAFQKEIDNTVTQRYKSILVTDRFQIPIDFLLFEVGESLSLSLCLSFRIVSFHFISFIRWMLCIRKRSRKQKPSKWRQRNIRIWEILFNINFNGIKVESVYGMWEKLTRRIDDIIKEIGREIKSDSTKKTKKKKKHATYTVNIWQWKMRNESGEFVYYWMLKRCDDLFPTLQHFTMRYAS